MKILIEEYEYDSALIKKVLKGYELPKHGNQNMCATDSVGYYFDTTLNDCLFFLPKVLLTDDGREEDDGDVDDSLDSEEQRPKEARQSLVLGRYRPEDIIDPDEPLNGVVVDKSDRDFLHNFSIWIYRALYVYREHNPKEHSIKNESLAQLDNSGNEIHGSHLDSVLALIKFHNENRDFLLFTMQNIKRGYNKINWNKTISHRTAITQSNGSVLYMNPVNQKKQINYEEELLVIFYSILNYINKTMGFSVAFNLNFELIPVEIFENYLKGYGRGRLLQIKYKYFSDKSLRLWNLCYLYFDRSWQMYSSQQNKEYLLSNTFEKVFEDIIDDLIGEKDIMPVLKNQKDGKMVDHIYRWQSLLTESNIYYVGDSKYYKIGHPVQGSALYKQYTYAKNIIQYNLDLFLAKERGKHHRYADQQLPYRDKMTEGYNITPNFFISATIDKDEFDFNEPHLSYHFQDADTNVRRPFMQKHFENRLFDRDTLWLSQYDINFLYVIALYVRENSFAKEHFRKDARDLFRKELIPVIEEAFDFYILEKKDKSRRLADIVNEHFRLLNGKVYHPYEEKDNNDDILILALEKDDAFNEENQDVFSILAKDFVIYEDFMLDDNIETFLQQNKNKCTYGKE